MDQKFQTARQVLVEAHLQLRRIKQLGPMLLPPVNKAGVAKDIPKVLPHPNQSDILALAVLLTTPPLVPAATQKSQPPEIKAGAYFYLRKGSTGGHVHAYLLVWAVKNLLWLKKCKARRHGASFYTVLS